MPLRSCPCLLTTGTGERVALRVKLAALPLHAGLVVHEEEEEEEDAEKDEEDKGHREALMAK